MVELHISQPGVPIPRFCNRGVVFFFGRVSEPIGGRNTIDVNPLSQPVNALAVRKIGRSEFEISLRRRKRELATLGHALRSQYKSIGNNRRGRSAGSTREADIGMGGEVEDLAVDVIAGHELPLIGSYLTNPFAGESTIPSSGRSISDAKQNAVRDCALGMQSNAKSECCITNECNQSLLHGGSMATRWGGSEQRSYLGYRDFPV